MFRLGARDRIDFLSFLNAYIILGLVFYAAGMVAWIYALSKEQMVTVYAFTALTFVLVYLGGVSILGEHINAAKRAGVALVIFGLYVVSTN